MNVRQIKGNTWVLEGFELIPLYRLENNTCILLDTGLNALVSVFLDWMQAADYTADRVAAYVVGDRETVAEAIRLSMGTVPSIVPLRSDPANEQAPSSKALGDLTAIGKILLERLMLDANCPWGAERIRELAQEDPGAV